MPLVNITTIRREKTDLGGALDVFSVSSNEAGLMLVLCAGHVESVLWFQNCVWISSLWEFILWSCLRFPSDENTDNI